ncbi:MAG: (4Fe-4S)-binding protein [Bacteroidota bacterium]
MENIKEYSNGEVTIVWKPKSCIHSGICVRGLGEVFKPKEKPWIKIDAASTDELINQVSVCPSGALSYYLNGEKNQETEQLVLRLRFLRMDQF